MSEPSELPMFPLGSVLLPGMLLPLHIFEARYQQMMSDLVAADGDSFGVTLIERGHEVGGGDIRAMIGCRAQVLECVQGPDGRWGVLAAGTERIRIHEWLPDEPYPRALVVAEPDSGVGLSGDESTRLEQLERRVRRCGALASELGLAAPAEVELSRDPEQWTFQLAVLAPLGSLDRQRILAAGSARLRLELLEDLVAEQEVLLEGRLRLGGPDDEPPA